MGGFLNKLSYDLGKNSFVGMELTDVVNYVEHLFFLRLYKRLMLLRSKLKFTKFLYLAKKPKKINVLFQKTSPRKHINTDNFLNYKSKKKKKKIRKAFPETDLLGNKYYKVKSCNDLTFLMKILVICVYSAPKIVRNNLEIQNLKRVIDTELLANDILINPLNEEEFTLNEKMTKDDIVPYALNYYQTKYFQNHKAHFSNDFLKIYFLKKRQEKLKCREYSFRLLFRNTMCKLYLIKRIPSVIISLRFNRL